MGAAVVGILVGTEVGCPVGMVGREVGCCEKDGMELTDGTSVGANDEEGRAVGESEGDGEGASDTVGFNVGETVGKFVGSKVRDG